MTYSHTQHTLAAFSFVTAMMIWQIGQRLEFYGYAPLWFVAAITALVTSSGISLILDGQWNIGEKQKGA